MWLFSALFSLNMSDIQETCQKNAAAALTVGRRDVAKVTILSVYIRVSWWWRSKNRLKVILQLLSD